MTHMTWRRVDCDGVFTDETVNHMIEKCDLGQIWISLVLVYLIFVIDLPGNRTKMIINSPFGDDYYLAWSFQDFWNYLCNYCAFTYLYFVFLRDGHVISEEFPLQCQSTLHSFQTIHWKPKLTNCWKLFRAGKECCIKLRTKYK